jgi:phage tail tape-measure protein
MHLAHAQGTEFAATWDDHHPAKEHNMSESVKPQAAETAKSENPNAGVTGHPLGAMAGAAAGAAAGAVAGIAAGPVGSLAGAIGGAVLGASAASGPLASSTGPVVDDKEHPTTREGEPAQQPLAATSNGGVPPATSEKNR